MTRGKPLAPAAASSFARSSAVYISSVTSMGVSFAAAATLLNNTPALSASPRTIPTAKPAASERQSEDAMNSTSNSELSHLQRRTTLGYGKEPTTVKQPLTYQRT